MAAPTPADAIAYIGLDSYTEDQITAAFTAEKAAQRSVCRVPNGDAPPGTALDRMTVAAINTADGSSWGDDAYVEFREVMCTNTGTVVPTSPTADDEPASGDFDATVWLKGDQSELDGSTGNGGTQLAYVYGGGPLIPFEVVYGEIYVVAFGCYQNQTDYTGTVVRYGNLIEAIALPDSPWPEDLVEALLRRTAHNLALRGLPLGVQASISEGAVATTRVGGTDPEVRRLEAPHRKRVVG